MTKPRLAQKLMSGDFSVPAQLNASLSDWGSPGFVTERLRERVLVTAHGAGSLFVRQWSVGAPEFNLAVDLPCVAPPFQHCWIECQVDDGVWGVAWDAIDLSLATDADFVARGWRPENLVGARWLLLGFLFVGSAAGARGPLASAVVFVDESGRVLRAAANPRRSAGMDMMGPFCPSLLALSLMHCKNVRLVEGEYVNTPPAAPGKRARPEYVKHYTLEIDPMREVLRREGRLDEVGIKQALHLCRGHFKDYRQSGLFGKVKGLFWWAPHERGSADVGINVKDYAVKPDGRDGD